MFTFLPPRSEPYLPPSMQRQQQATNNLLRARRLSANEAEDILSVISSATKTFPSSYLGKEHSCIHKVFIRTAEELFKPVRKAAESFSPSVLHPTEADNEPVASVMSRTVARPAPHSLANFTMTSRTVSLESKVRLQKQLKIKDPFGASCSLLQKDVPASAGRAGVLQLSIGERTGALILTFATPLPPLCLVAGNAAEGSTRLAKLLAGNTAGAVDTAISALDDPTDPDELHAAIKTALQPNWLSAYQNAVIKLRDTHTFDLSSAASVTTAIWHGSNLFVTQSGLNTLLMLCYKKIRVLACPALRNNVENIHVLAQKPISAALQNALQQAGSCAGIFYCAQEGDLEPDVKSFPVARNARETLIFIDRPIPHGCSIDFLERADLYQLRPAEIAERIADLCISFGASRDLHVAAFHSPDLIPGELLSC